jgi:hypothetical protein
MISKRVRNTARLIVSAARLVCSSPPLVWCVRRHRPFGLVVAAET